MATAKGNTIPSYEDDPVDISVNEHIHAVGGWPTKYLHRADMVLLVNTPASGVTLEASAPRIRYRNQTAGTLYEKTGLFYAAE